MYFKVLFSIFNNDQNKPQIMNNKSEITMDSGTFIGDIISWMFGIVALAIGIINTLWGNNPGYGIFIILLSFVYFPPVTVLIKKITGISIHYILKILLAIFILWSALGVGELGDKIDIMMRNL